MTPHHACRPRLAACPAEVRQAPCDVHAALEALLGDPTGATGSPSLMARVLARLAAAERQLAVQRQRIAHLETLVMTDELTGLLNRRGFFDHFRRALSAAARRPEAAGMLILCDLDGLKAINDTLGHPAGDAYLAEAGRVLLASVRASDVVARLGGDEFALILHGCTPGQGARRAMDIAERLHAAHLAWNGRRLPLRASFGTQPYRAGDREDEVLRLADQSLYAAKALAAGDRRAAIPA